MKNQRYSGDVAPLTAPVGGVTAGSPYLIGSLPVVACNDGDAAATVNFARRGAFDVPVTAADGGGNSAVAQGDKIYISGAGVLSKIATGTLWGYAWGTLTAGATGSVLVEIAA